MGDAPLSSISVQGNVQAGGKLVAVGDVNGTVSLLEVRNAVGRGVLTPFRLERETKNR